MPQFDSTTRTKIAALRTRRTNGETLEPYELVEVQWPSPDGTIYYSVTQVDEVASVAPSVSPIETRLMADSMPDWFLPAKVGTLIGDEEIDLTFWDGDDAMSDLITTHGEGVKVVLHYWFPQETLLLTVWQGHLRNEEENGFGLLKLKAAQGFRASDAIVPGRAHWEPCQRIFGGLLATQAEIDEHGCPYNLHIGGSIGTNDPDTGLPWTFCPRLTTANCTERGVNPLRHLSHATMLNTVINEQTHGGRIFSTSEGNTTGLKEPVRVVMGIKRVYGFPVMLSRRDTNNNHPDQGFYLAMYEACEGPIQSFQNTVVTVGGASQAVVPMHFNWRLGGPEEGPYTLQSQLTPHGFSNTAHILYNFGWINPAAIEPDDAEAGSTITGLSDLRIYSDEDTYSTGVSSNPAWQIMRILCDKRWGFGLDYERLNIQSFIDAATWCQAYVRFTDTFGTNWDHVRAQSNVELIGRKVQQQIEDLCRAMRLSQPFLFDGKIHIMPLAALTEGELDDCPVFTDQGTTARNVIVESRDGAMLSTLKISRKSDLDLPNRIECKFDDSTKDYVETPLNPVEDVDAQLRAGRVVGDHSRKTNKKEYPLLGVVVKEQAMKDAWSILDLGEFDSGGLQNNCRIKFRVWFADALDLHPYKVIKYVNTKLQAQYGFSFFRIVGDGIEKKNDLEYEITAQAYNETYMETFESVISIVTPDVCDAGYHWDPVTEMCVIDGCDPGYHWDPVQMACVPDIGDRCTLTFGTVAMVDGVLVVPIEPCS